jgi:predicted PurR-regulated permease PerM
MRIDRFTVLLVLGIIIAATIAFWPLMGMFFVAGSFAVVMMPVQRSLSRCVPAWFSAFLLTVGLISTLVLVFLLLAGMLVQHTGTILSMVEKILSWAASILDGATQLGLPDLIAGVRAWFRGEFLGLESSLMELIPRIPEWIVLFIVFGLALYLALLKGDAVFGEVTLALPDASARGIGTLAATVSDTLYSVYVLHVAVSIVTFLLAVPFFSLLGYGNPLFFAAATAIFELIPVFGSLAVLVFLGIFAVASGDYRGLLLVILVGYPLLSAFPDFLLRPALAGKRLDVHPVLLLIGFIGGIATMGLIGFVLGPLFVALLASGYHVLIEGLEGSVGVRGAGIVGRESGESPASTE